MWTHETLTAKLRAEGITVEQIEEVEPTLEDTFTLLAHLDQDSAE